MYEKIARKGAKTLYFARSAQEGETWVSVYVSYLSSAEFSS